MKMNKHQAEQWKERTSGELYIKEQTFFRHSDLFLENYSDIKTNLLSILNGKLLNLEFRSRYIKRKNPYYTGRITANSLNIAIRNRFKNSEMDFKYEVTFNEGVFFESAQTAGFDFAYFDDRYNLVNLRNFCFGRRPVFNGKELWEKELNNNPFWRNLSKEMKLEEFPSGKDINLKKQTPTILGEIQFGNWGLVYRDILKIIQVESDEDVDLFVYINAAGSLVNAISDSTVNYYNSLKIFEEYKNILNMPIWLIGVDII